MITINEVCFSYTGKKETLRDISLSIKAGECVLLCGESGCGKTTVTKLVNGLIPHFSEGCRLRGSVMVAGHSVGETELYELAKSIGSVFQNPKSQFFNLDTDSELAFGLENEGASPQWMKRRISQTVNDLDIMHLMHRNIFSLSGGEKQTLAFASVYAMNPKVYVLDEPTANLDEEAITRLRKQILNLKKAGQTVVIAEHRLYFLADLVDHAYYFQKGRLMQHFSGEEFCSLSHTSRIKMGLRTMEPTSLELPDYKNEIVKEGLWVERLSCGYKKSPLVFTDLSFAAVPGEILAVTGHNGAGKTTLMRCLCGLIKECSGRVVLDGKPMNVRERRKKSFCVMQDVNHQLFYDSVWNECAQASGEQNEDMERVLAAFDLLSLRDSHPMALSGGQKQRLAVAAAMLSGKHLLIFDEPTSGLDYRHMLEVRSVVRQLADRGHIILIVSHDKEFIQGACDRVLEIK